jgi:hypothetical protein
METHQRAVHAASTVDSSAISRQRKKLKKSSEFNSMTEEAKQQALAKIKEDTLHERYVPPLLY